MTLGIPYTPTLMQKCKNKICFDRLEKLAWRQTGRQMWHWHCSPSHLQLEILLGYHTQHQISDLCFTNDISQKNNCSKAAGIKPQHIEHHRSTCHH